MCEDWERVIKSNKMPYIWVYVKKTETECNVLFVFNSFYVYYLIRYSMQTVKAGGSDISPFSS